MKDFYRLAYELGKAYGVREGMKMYLDKTGMQGVMGVVMAFGGVIIGLYIVGVVTGSLGTQVSSGTMVMNAKWNTTITALDTSSSGTFSLAGVLPIAIIGVGILGLLMSAFAR